MQYRDFTTKRRFLTIRALATLLASAVSAPVAKGQPVDFLEEFNGPNLDSAWTFEGDPNNHPDTIAGSYDFTDTFGQPGTKFSRSMSGTPGSFTQELELVLDPFGQTGSGGTQNDFKWKSFGSDGYMEIIINSFGNMRLWHNDFSDGADNIVPYTSIGYSDGDLLKLTMNYNQSADTVDYSYSLNGGLTVPFYTGGGLHGPIGDVVTSFVEAQLFKWGSRPDQALASVHSWSVTATAPGDFNSDGVSNGLDFLLWQQNPNLGILADWEARYGTQPKVAETSAVPEPSVGLLMLAATAVLGLSRGFRQ